MKKEELLRRIGQSSQIYGIRDYSLRGGKADGMRVLEIDNGAGLSFSVLPDRGLDPFRAVYKGINLSYISSIAPAAPAYADNTPASFFSHFNAGLVTTCGLQNVGPANNFNGKQKLQHGRYSTIPAEEVCARTYEDSDIPCMEIEGTVTEGRFFNETLILKRRIACRYGENKITIRDRIANRGYEKQELMLLYHCNLGYPLIDSESYLVTPSSIVKPRDDDAQKGIDTYMMFHDPVHGYAEQVFYHDLEEDKNGRIYAAVVNPKLGLAVKISFKKSELPYMTEWKMMGEQLYVVGIEPGNCHVEGSESEEKRGTLIWLEPGETREYGIEIEILEGKDAAAL